MMKMDDQWFGMAEDMFIFNNKFLNLRVLINITIVSIISLSVAQEIVANNYTRYSVRNRAALRRNLPARTYDYDSVY